MENETSFKTKTGSCRISPDSIVLTRERMRGAVSQIICGNGIARVLTLYGLIAVWLFSQASKSLQTGDIFSAVLLGILGLSLIYTIIRSLNCSAASTISRQAIKEVQFIEGHAGLTRSRFIVTFENKFGRIKKRLILLPGSLNNGLEETKIALKVMIAEGLLER